MMGGDDAAEEGPKRKLPDPIVEKLLEEDGGMVLGRPTRHFRWRTRSTMPMNLPMGMSMEIATDQTEDVWVADLKIDPKILRSFEGMGAGVALPEDMQKIVEAAKQTQKGFPLKRVVVATSKTTSTGTGMMAKMMAKSMAKQDDDKPTKTTYVVTELSEEKVPAVDVLHPRRLHRDRDDGPRHEDAGHEPAELTSGLPGRPQSRDAVQPPSRQAWFSPPWQWYWISRAPSWRPPPSTSRHLPLATLTIW